MSKPIGTGGNATAKLTRISVAIAGLAGALGVVLLAASAHADTSPLVRSAADVLLIHAPAFLGLGILAQVRHTSFLAAAVLLMSAGCLLFCGDILARVYLDTRLFPMAAPTGGFALIAGWLALALAAPRLRARG
ncbi:MAG: DUF423 domain-containing protein [Rhodobacteraceae bacterium]|nr:DUF423 domain-containing protein [Paracoccaceae bacterium]